MSDLSGILTSVAMAAKAASMALPGVAATVARIAAEALGLAADFAASGLDPVAEIERVRRVDPYLAKVDAEVAEALDARFPNDDPYDGVDNG